MRLQRKNNRARALNRAFAGFQHRSKLRLRRSRTSARSATFRNPRTAR